MQNPILKPVSSTQAMECSMKTGATAGPHHRDTNGEGGRPIPVHSIHAPALLPGRNRMKTKTGRNLTWRDRVSDIARATRSFGHLLALGMGLLIAAAAAHAAIPAAERQVLLNLYSSTNGLGWTDSTGWNGAAGTECTWFGVTCDAGSSQLVAIELSLNRLSGTLPVLGNLSQLQTFDVSDNALTGSIPSLTGLTNLKYFIAFGNLLSGPIPPLTGLTNLNDFAAFTNLLSGPIPTLNGLTSLQFFQVGGNQLTGSIPTLSGLTSLRGFFAGSNQLTGSIPPLSGLTSLSNFTVPNNQLTGPIPALGGTNLITFDAHNNALSGPIPLLTGLTNLEFFSVYYNGLTGPIPALTGLTNLKEIQVGLTSLTGPVPDPPSPNNLVPGMSMLCPNALAFASSGATQRAWDIATGVTPWYSTCSSDEIFLDGFE